MTPPLRVDLDISEREQLKRAALALLKSIHGIATPSFIGAAPANQHLLPSRILETFARFKQQPEAPALVVNGLPMEYCPPTPMRINFNRNASPPSLDEAAHILLASCLGQVFTYDTIQFGNFINDIIPVPEDADLPISSGSSNLFDFHTEDAFHAIPGDFLGLLCARNNDCIPTIISFIQDTALSQKCIETLRQERFYVRPNIAHQVAADGVPRRSILFGSNNHRYLRVNFNKTSAAPGDEDAVAALHELHVALENSQQEIALRAGEAIYIDNLRVAHGRKPYAPKFNGKDRWLKRLYVQSAWRMTAEHRHPDLDYTLKGHP